jgi:hypothetical protein
MFEFIAQFIGELLIQGLMEIGFRSLADVFKKKRNPIFSAIGCILWGAIAGGISLAVFPASFIARSDLKLLNLLTPVLVGALMVLLGRLRARKGRDLVELDRFGYAFLFALTMSLVRFLWAT